VGKEIAFVLIIYPKHSISIKSAELEPIINYYPIALLIWVWWKQILIKSQYDSNSYNIWRILFAFIWASKSYNAFHIVLFIWYLGPVFILSIVLKFGQTGSTWDPANPELESGRIKEKIGKGETRCNPADSACWPRQNPVKNSVATRWLLFF
jgi:hypothetical protein